MSISKIEIATRYITSDNTMFEDYKKAYKYETNYQMLQVVLKHNYSLYNHYYIVLDVFKSILEKADDIREILNEYSEETFH